MNVVGLYPSIPHGSGFKVLHEKLEERNDKSVLTVDLINITDSVLNNNYFEFDSYTKQQISGPAKGTKFAPSLCMFFHG